MNARISTALAAAAIGLAVLAVPAVGQAATVGYYDNCSGAGRPGQQAVITAAGHAAIDMVDINATTLASVDALFVSRSYCSDGEYLAAFPAITNAVQNQGLVLIVHDRIVDGAYIPGSAGMNFSIPYNEINVDFPAGSPILTGPAGLLTNGTLDNGNSSTHGAVAVTSLPAGSQILANDGNVASAVTMTYPYGTGKVVYSTIPLDCYLAGGGCSASAVSAGMQAYATNLLAWAVGPTFTTCAAEGYSGAKLTLCRQVCEIDQSPTRLTSLIKLYMTIYRTEPPCGR